MGQAIDFLTREVTEEVTKKAEPLHDNLDLGAIFSETGFKEAIWPSLDFRISGREALHVCGLMSTPFGFHEETGDFDPGEYNVHDKNAVIAVRFSPETVGDSESIWLFECGFQVFADGEWHFKRDVGGNFEKEREGQRLFLKANPKKYPNG
jgi:hypothetical protein